VAEVGSTAVRIHSHQHFPGRKLFGIFMACPALARGRLTTEGSRPIDNLQAALPVYTRWKAAIRVGSPGGLAIRVRYYDGPAATITQLRPAGESGPYGQVERQPASSLLLGFTRAPAWASAPQPTSPIQRSRPPAARRQITPGHGNSPDSRPCVATSATGSRSPPGSRGPGGLSSEFVEAFPGGYRGTSWQ